MIFPLLCALLLLARLCHSGALWAEETLPMAAAWQMRLGKTLYQEIWFDKPPLLAAMYLLWGVHPGWLLRVAGAIYVAFACALVRGFAHRIWGPREGIWAAGLLAFFLTFGLASAVIPLAADLVMMLPHVAAVYLAWRRRPFWSGTLAGLAFLINVKGLFVLAACGLWCWNSPLLLLLGFALPNGMAAGWLWWNGALADYFEQVWSWGRLYAGYTFVSDPVWNGLRRSLNWAGFHAALLVTAIYGWFREPAYARWRWAAWLALSFGAVALGWRFFPRYYLQLLPPLVLMGARGAALLQGRRRLVLALLLIPLIRFGPRYGVLAADLLRGRPHEWRDLAMDRDSREAAAVVNSLAHPGDTLFVWGFRPELYVYTRLPAACRYLDSQPLTGVPADRHLTMTWPVAPAIVGEHQAELSQCFPSFVVDGLGPMNPHLAPEAFAGLRAWLANYQPVQRTRLCVIYRLLPNPARPTLFQER